MESACLLVSDVDGTLLGDDQALQAFADWHAATAQQMRLVYSSGRFVESVLDSVNQSALPVPDAIVGGVGTEICLFPQATPLSGWPEIRGPWDPETVRRLMTQFDDLELQPIALQSLHKVSFFALDLTSQQLEAIKTSLQQAELAADVVYSSRRDLDVLPAGINKGAAAQRLAKLWQVPPHQVFVCGDSGNDSSMFDSGFCGIVVGNAHEELRRLTHRVYQAQSTYAAGVLEGLQYWLRLHQVGPQELGTRLGETPVATNQRPAGAITACRPIT